MTTGAISESAVRPADSVELRLGLDFPILTAAYCRWRAEGLFPQIFHRTPEMSLVEFLDYNYQPTVEPVGCFIAQALVGVGWIVQARKVQGKLVAEVGAAFFHTTPLAVWRRSLQMFLAHAFVDRGFAEVYGLCAQGNRAGHLISQRAGMHEVECPPWIEALPDTQAYSIDWQTWAMEHTT